MAKIKLTDRTLESLRSVFPKGHSSAGRKMATGDRYELLDVGVSGFGVRVTDKGLRTFILKTRYPGSPHPTRRALGEYPAMRLAEARDKAIEWRKLIARGIDPAIQEGRQREAMIRQRANTFAAVAEAFIADKLPSERKGREVERDIRNEFIPKLGPRPITELTDLDIREIIIAKKRTAPAQARNLLGTAKRLFAWAVDQRVYGLTASPAEPLKPSKIIGEKISGQRILSDAELVALWRAAGRVPYPHGPVYRLLILSALRLNEGADAAWPEIDRANALWTIPAERMKGRNSKARPHVVPLITDIASLLDELPIFKTGDYMFSTTHGASPVWMSDKIKKRIDALMIEELSKMAKQRGDDSAKVKLLPWKNHDIRRTVRSGLSRLKVTEEAREAVMAHARPGIKGTYDLYDYLDEKREALELWAAHVRGLIEPTPANVIKLQSRA